MTTRHQLSGQTKVTCFVLAIVVLLVATVHFALNLGQRTVVARTVSWTDLSCDRCNNFTYDYLLRSERLCADEDVHLVFLVLSTPGSTEVRTLIRDTWAGMKSHHGQLIKSVFVIGHPHDQEVNKRLQKENQAFGDIIQGHFVDSYRSLTEKVMFGLKWVRQYCTSARFIVKTDQDVFHNPANYLSYVANVKHERLVGGRCLTFPPRRDTDTKSYVAYDAYKYLYSPYYCQGGAYILSKQALEDIVKVADNTRYNPMEDMFIVGACRVAVGISFTQIPGVLARTRTPCFLTKHALSVHLADPSLMKDYWGTVTDDTTDCGTTYAHQVTSMRLFGCILGLVTFVIFWMFVLCCVIGLRHDLSQFYRQIIRAHLHSRYFRGKPTLNPSDVDIRSHRKHNGVHTDRYNS